MSSSIIKLQINHSILPGMYLCIKHFAIHPSNLQIHHSLACWHYVRFSNYFSYFHKLNYIILYSKIIYCLMIYDYILHISTIILPNFKSLVHLFNKLLNYSINYLSYQISTKPINLLPFFSSFYLSFPIFWQYWINQQSISPSNAASTQTFRPLNQP